MVSSTFSLLDFSKNEFVQEVTPLVERALRAYDCDIAYFKVTNVSERNYKILAISKSYALWHLEFEVHNPERWEHHAIQSSSSLKYCTELIELRKSFEEIQGLSAEETNSECLKFFITTKPFKFD